MADVFISYARADRENVAPIVQALEQLGLSVWWDSAIVPGERWDDLIKSEIEKAKCVVVVWTVNSIESHWVKDEAAFARDRDKLVPVSIGGAHPPLGFRQFQTLMLSGEDTDRALKQSELLLHAVARLVGRNQEAEVLQRAAQRLSAGLVAVPVAVGIAGKRLTEVVHKGSAWVRGGGPRDALKDGWALVRRYPGRSAMAAAALGGAIAGTVELIDRACLSCSTHIIRITTTGFSPSRIDVCERDSFVFVNETAAAVDVVRYTRAKQYSWDRPSQPPALGPPSIDSLRGRAVVNAGSRSAPWTWYVSGYRTQYPTENRNGEYGMGIPGTTHRLEVLSRLC